MLSFALLVERIVVLRILFKIAAKLSSEIGMETIDQPILIQLHNGGETLNALDSLTEIKRVIKWASALL